MITKKLGYFYIKPCVIRKNKCRTKSFTVPKRPNNHSVSGMVIPLQARWHNLEYAISL